MDEHKSVIEEFLKDGWVVVLIGVAAMTARILTIAERSTILDQIKKIVVAAISSAIMWALIHDLPISDVVKASIYGITGFISSEIIQGVVKIGKTFSKSPLVIIRKIFLRK